MQDGGCVHPTPLGAVIVSFRLPGREAGDSKPGRCCERCCRAGRITISPARMLLQAHWSVANTRDHSRCSWVHFPRQMAMMQLLSLVSFNDQAAGDRIAIC